MKYFVNGGRLQPEVLAPPMPVDCELRAIRRVGIASTVFAVLLGAVIGQLMYLAVDGEWSAGQAEQVEMIRLRRELTAARQRAEEAGERAVDVEHACDREVTQLRRELTTAQWGAEKAGERAVDVGHECDRVVSHLCTCPDRGSAR
jgi:hypothetical protein